MAEKKNTEELVTVHLFKDANKYKDDVTVHVNGRRWTIQRGKTVQVPKAVAEVLEHSMGQDAETAELIASKSEEFKAAAKFM
jgi:hypothetical protein